MKTAAEVRGILDLVELVRGTAKKSASPGGDPLPGPIRSGLEGLEASAARVREILDAAVEPGAVAPDIAVQSAVRSGRLVPALAECLAGVERVRRLACDGRLPWAKELELRVARALAPDPALARSCRETSRVYVPGSREPLAVLLATVKGVSEPGSCIVVEGGSATLGGPGCDLAFRDPSMSGVHAEIRLQRGVACLVVAGDRKVSVGGISVDRGSSETRVFHGDFICLAEEAWVQAMIPLESARRRMPTDRLELGPLAESGPELECVSACAGGCGKALDPRDIEELRAFVLEGNSAICLDCVLARSAAFLLLDDYILVHRLKGGGMGEVHAALDRRTGRVVAVKTLREIVANDPGARARFAREARLLVRLEHPNIVGFLGAGLAEDTPYLVMEFARGRTVARMIEKSGRIEPRAAIRLARQAARALAYAHATDIVHRDIKPENLVVGSDGTLRVIDLGLGKILSTSGESFITKPGTTIGTLAYMAPEQLEDSRLVDARADIYALGATLYEMLSGVRAFNVGRGMAGISRIIEGRFEPLESVAPDVPLELAGLVHHAMARSAGDRFPTADEFRLALEAIYGSLPRSSR